MSLKDVMSGLQLSSWAEAALVVFIVVFLAVSWRTYSRRHAAEYERARTLPLEDAARVTGERQT